MLIRSDPLSSRMTLSSIRAAGRGCAAGMINSHRLRRAKLIAQYGRHGNMTKWMSDLRGDCPKRNHAQMQRSDLIYLRSAPDCRPRRTYLHLSYSYAAPFGPAILVPQDPEPT